MLLIDRDVLAKLCAWDMMTAALKRSDYGAVHTLESAINNPLSRRMKRDYPSEAQTRVVAFGSQQSSMPVARDAALVDALMRIPGVDSGEARLIAVASESTDARLWTGDKVWLEALATSGHPVVQSLLGRVECVETIVADLVSRNGVGWVASRVALAPEADKSMRLVFGAAAVEDALDSWVRDARRRAGGLLLEM